MFRNYALDAKQIKARDFQMREAMKFHESLRELIKRKQKLDPATINWMEAETCPDFFHKLEESTDEVLREANVSSSLGQLFRYGVQDMMFDGYKDVPVIYPDIVQIRPSSNRQEWYAPLYGSEIPQEVAPGGKFLDSRLQGLDTVLVNKKIGRIIELERDLFDDDQTGQIATRASKLGARARYKEEYDVMAAVRAATYNTTIGNAPASNATLSQSALETADIALMGIRDPLGNRVFVMPTYLLVDPTNKFNASKLLNSTLQPSIPGTAGSETIGSAASGQTGWTGTENPLKGLYALGVSRFLGAGDWFLMEPRTSIPFQERDPLEITQENPQAGKSFENDTYRFKVRRRYNTTVLESRYLYAGFINATAPTI